MTMKRDVEKLVRLLVREHGCTTRRSGSDHVRVTGPNGVTITVSSTPKDAHALRNVRGDVRKYLGIPI